MSNQKMTKSRMRRRKQIIQHTIIGGMAILGLLTLITILALVVFNKNEIVFSKKNNTSITCQVGSGELPKVEARYRGTLIHRKGSEITVTTDGTVDFKKVGDYKISYTASHKDLTKTIRLTVKVVDEEPPKLKLVSDPNHYTPTGGTYQEEGYSAVDNYDGDITDKVTSVQKDDVITYTVKDSSGNEATATRKVVYKDMPDPEDKVVYLTFDDGPGQYTQKLLDVLDKYKVKATFFVTNQYPEYQDLLKEEAKRGHTVAIHSYSHDYKKIYSSKEAYVEDMEKMADIIKEQTGIKPFLVRFPGGSSNTISADYKKGIMTTLTKTLPELGYMYADWNVSSGDAGETTDTKKVYKNIIGGIKVCKHSVILQHDIKEFSVNAVEDVIKWGQKNGYTFLPLTQNSANNMVHHPVNN